MDEGRDDDNNDGDVSRLIAINICMYTYMCVCTRHAKEKKMNRCIIIKKRGKERE